MRRKANPWTVALLALVVTFACFWASGASARVVGQCALCHTMHNSQNGAIVNADGAQPALISIGSGCVGCHTGTNTTNIGTPTQPTPYITDASAPNYDVSGTETGTTTLAGGSFYWVQNGADPTGHNVVGIAGPDAIGLTPPGWSNNALFQQNDPGIKVAQGAAAWSSQLTCAGTYGCHGTRGTTSVLDDFGGVSGAHHALDAAIDGLTVGTSYRFLIGILGFEDKEAGTINKWEFEPTVSRHNQYKGVDKTDDATIADASTISYLCAECHGVFHSGAGAEGADDPDNPAGAPWIRHPTDYDMGNVRTKPDYAGYNGGGATPAYSVVSPVGSDDVSAMRSTVYATADDAIVTCISCHRAHGTPFDDLLRWDYDLMVSSGGGGNIGCFVCHSTKD